MYILDCDKKFNKKLPIPDFYSRFSSISQSSKPNIIVIKEQFDDPTFRYRGYNIIQTMKNNSKYNINCFLVRELSELYNIVNKLNLVIIQRALWSFELESFMNFLKDNDIKVLYDVDDLIYNTKYVPDYLNNIGAKDEEMIRHFFAISQRYQLIFEMCDGYIVTSKQLQDEIIKYYDKPTWVFHNYLNLEQETISKDIVNLKKNAYLNDKFIIGYFSGSNSHKRDLEIAEQALIKLINKYDNVYLKIVGIINLSSQLKKLKDEGRILISKCVPYEKLQYEMGKVDLNIIPLQKHNFNDCKSELKYFEASIVNTLTLATDNIVYQNCIEDGVDGFLSDEFSWFEKMEFIYLNHYKLRDIADNARIKCLKKYGSKEQESHLEKMYDDIFDKLNIES